jgi:tetratricopeptide (TPR) repeat protein
MQPTANLWETLCADLQTQRTQSAREEYLRVATDFADAARNVLRPGSNRLADAWEIAGDICRDAGGRQEARKFYLEAFSIAEGLQLDAQGARIAAKLAENFSVPGEEAQSISHCDKALRHLETAGDHSQHTFLLSLKAARQRALGDYPGAVETYREAMDLVEKLHGSNNADLAVLINNLGIALMEAGDLAGAEKAGLQALELREKLFGATHPEVAHSLSNLGVLYHYRGESVQASRYYRAALDIYCHFLQPDAPEIRILQENLKKLEAR